MMKDHEGCTRAFVWSSRAWYAGALEHEKEVIYFGMYSLEGGSSGEMSMVWKELGSRSVPQLQVFDDGWSALALFTDLIQELGDVDDENITPNEFIDILTRCGFKDNTEYNTGYDSPYQSEEIDLQAKLRVARQEVKRLEKILERGE